MQALPDVNVTIIADRFGAETTSDGAAGLWEDLYFSEHASGAGVTTVAAYQLWSEPHEDPAWKELQHFSLVVNCTGIGAARLFGDTEMYPVRGHVIRVRAPWIKSNYFLDECNYIIPQTNTVVLGGTAQRGDADCAPREEDRQHIWQGCLRIMPSLAQAKPEMEWVGLRPGRKSVRLEFEEIDLEGGEKLRVAMGEEE
ncbi:FAD-linked reductase, C-terminal domain-containing protein [Coccomyxa subellipsoidea C-169]|uniref:FAD-linked reductase, C-terminal domain-containing protein n=1 Tax=Coccomyxa subellipsoidea (strain C-169) TaxID=574566 RepID=I0Z240_COCSC|nr:FAD-linked reductase, C-terminal domain-containing protein [Coccomyxa subellipsoidea C-169]EIE24709.1 FAD-linked reductase, C-terminal domain-containing protein [Coccomyxa subellipsoidea C-169]|eukprot:XP_005649253.1 FAD-linked reductase, C-terminal domain-containing protein [Coccomyxa subellipsoidea C-169]